MTASPTYEELEHTIRELEEENHKLRLAESALREKEAHFRLVAENVSDIVWTTDINLKPTYVSPSVTRVRDFSVEEALGQSLEECVTPESLKVISKLYAEVLTNMETAQAERMVIPTVDLEMRCKDGSTIWAEVRGIVLEETENRPREIVGIARDITERKRAEEDLRLSEARLAAAQRIARLGNWDWDIETSKLFWSDDVYRIYGLSPQELNITYDAVMERVHPDDRALFGSSFEETLEYQKPFCIDHRIVRPDGSERFVHEEAEVLIDKEGKLIRMAGTVQDITDRKRAEQRILLANERLQYLLRYTSVIVYTTRSAGDYGTTFISNNIVDILGYAPADFLKKPSFWIDRIHLEDVHRIMSELPKLFLRDSYVHEYRFRHKDGNYIWIRDGMRLVRDKHQKPVEIVGYRIDITELKRLEAELVHARIESDNAYKAP